VVGEVSRGRFVVLEDLWCYKCYKGET